MYIKWSPIDSVTASAKSFELSILKKYSNFMLNDAEQCENSDCNCVKKISVIFVLYRFMVIVSYLFFLGGLWQLEVILKKTIRNRCGNCQKKRIKSTKKLCKHCSISEGNNVSWKYKITILLKQKQREQFCRKHLLLNLFLQIIIIEKINSVQMLLF